jgi:uncharacterized protein (TIGR00369 family)
MSDDMTHPEWGPERSRLLTWRDPLPTAARISDMSGAEFVQALLDGTFPEPPFAALVGARLVSAGDGEAVLRCVPDESFYSPIGMVHGGLLCTLLDTVAGLAVHSLLAARTGYSTIEIKVNFLRPLRGGGGELEARGRVVKLGRSVAFAECEARAEDGELVGAASTSLLIARLS